MTSFHVRFAGATMRLLLSFSFLYLPSAAAAASTTASRFASEALPIELGDIQRGVGLTAGEPDCFRLETPSAGLLMLDVAVAGDAEAEPLLGLLAAGCGGSTAVVERSAAHLLVRASAARSLVACVGPQDPRQRLGDYRLRTAFQPTGSCKSTDPEQIEAEPDPLIGCAGFDRSTDPEQIEAEPDPLLAGGVLGKSTDPEQIEAEPDPLRAGSPIGSLCAAGELDDHGDAFPCATPVVPGRLASGEIANARGDDRDLFVFRLSAFSTVQIETAGEVDTFGGIFDRRGQRLAATADGGQDGNFRLVKALPPGLYFVRVEGQAWSQGAYSLAIDTLERGW